jgi:heme exporter protein C
VLLVILLLIMPRFSESLHPGKGGNPGFNTYDLDSSLRLVFYPAVLGWILTGLWMQQLILRMARIRERWDHTSHGIS